MFVRNLELIAEEFFTKHNVTDYLLGAIAGGDLEQPGHTSAVLVALIVSHQNVFFEEMSVRMGEDALKACSIQRISKFQD